MARVRNVEIQNFRCIRTLSWTPHKGINCLIGPGDSGKSAILDAIDLCLGARRSLQITDADFFDLDVEKPISIEVTIGALEDGLKNLDTYGSFLRGFTSDGKIEDEPESGAEIVLTIGLSIDADLEPVWSLVSERAKAEGVTRFLSWSDRVRLGPTRIGAVSDYNLSWRRGSVLNQLSDEKPDVTAALSKAAREARTSFGEQAEEQLGETLTIVGDTARELGIAINGSPKAMLDAHSISFSGGTIALHAGDGVPLRSLGLGSTRLLIAGLQRKASKEFSVLLVDELEHGLEPHRILRLLDSIGAKEKNPPLQGFLTTHSAVAVRELSGDQLWIVRRTGDKHSIAPLGTTDAIQGTIRKYPEAFLSARVVVCEGASEVGLLRGLDRYFASRGAVSLNALGVSLVDAGGSGNIYDRANTFLELGYETAVLRDSDVKPDPGEEAAFLVCGGKLLAWSGDRTLEDELFASLSEDAVLQMIERAIELHDEEYVDSCIRSTSTGLVTLADCRTGVDVRKRGVLGKASRSKKAGWYKSVSWMADVAHDIVGPDFDKADKAFVDSLADLSSWMTGDGK